MEKIKLYIILIGNILKIVFLLLILSEISLLIPVDRDKVERVINKLNVGKMKFFLSIIYKYYQIILLRI